MARIGFLTLYATGHINPAAALGKALEERGHAVTFFNLLDVAPVFSERGLRFVPFGLDDYPAGSIRESFEKIAKLQGAAGFAYFLERMIKLAGIAFRELPGLIEQEGIEALVIDQLFPGGGTVAQHLKLPYASQANALAVNRDPGVPPPTLPWGYDASEAGVARNGKGWAGIAQAFGPWMAADNAQREAWGLAPYTDLLEGSFSPLAQIAQQPETFELPRTERPASLHYVGPMNHPATRKQVSFPWERLSGKPVIYASMGTLQNGLDWVFRMMLEACSTLAVQIVLSLGGSSLDVAALGELPENAVVVPYAPQFDVLGRASLCITHAGLNTVLDALTLGVPMVAIPITNDQPGVAARLQWSGAGEAIPLDQLTVERLRETVAKVMAEPAYRERAKAIQGAIAELSPLTRACEIIEQDVLTKTTS